MKPGSVIVDLGADGGGNCELSKPGETVHVGGVTILAPLNLPATMPYHASLLFSRNLTAFVLAFTKDKAFVLDLSRRHPAGRHHHARRRGEARAHPRGAARRTDHVTSDFWSTLFVFVLASFIGLGVIRRVSRLLHTPLMSLTNAISAIASSGAILVTGGDYPLRDPHPRRDRALRLDDQHRQRLPDHRSHAEDVQDRQQGRRRPARADR